jgi:hypothetical protein
MNNEFFVGKPTSLCGSVVSCDGHCVQIRSLKHQFEISSKQTIDKLKWTDSTFNKVYSNYMTGTEGCSQRQEVLNRMAEIFTSRKK